jgi:hypothetical protein
MLGRDVMMDLGWSRPTPAHSFEDLLQFGGGELDVRLIERSVHPVAEDVVILEEPVTQRLAELRGDFDKATVALPGLGIEQLLFLLIGQALARAAALFVFSALLVATPVGEAFLQRGGDLTELREEVVAELLVERSAQVFVTGSEALACSSVGGSRVRHGQRGGGGSA